MLGPQHLKHVIAFFDGIDLALSKRMLRNHPPDEGALTNELCALLDADTQAAEGELEYDLGKLNTDLAALGDGLDFKVTLDTHPHNSAMERHVSQSDFGLVLTYDNFILPDTSWMTAYLVQAKRLFRNPVSREYDEGAAFRSINVEQELRIERLAGILGEDALRYCLYCPPTSALPEPARTKVRALHLRNLSGRLFDGACELALRDILAAKGGIDAGVWIRRTETPARTLVHHHSKAFCSTLPLTWFLVAQFARNREGYLLPSYGGLLDNTKNEKVERVRRIVTGDEQAVDELIAELSEAGEKLGAPRITVLPRHTITIGVSVGRSLPSEVARAWVG